MVVPEGSWLIEQSETDRNSCVGLIDTRELHWTDTRVP